MVSLRWVSEQLLTMEVHCTTLKGASDFHCIVLSVLWRCWLGGRKGIRPVKKLSGGLLAWLSLWSEMQTFIWPSWCHCHSLSLATVKSRLVLPYWYRLTRVVLEKGPLNGCVCFALEFLCKWVLSVLCLQCFDTVGWVAGSGVVLAWLSVWSEVQTCIWPSWCHCPATHCLLLL